MKKSKMEVKWAKNGPKPEPGSQLNLHRNRSKSLTSKERKTYKKTRDGEFFEKRMNKSRVFLYVFSQNIKSGVF